MRERERHLWLCVRDALISIHDALASLEAAPEELKQAIRRFDEVLLGRKADPGYYGLPGEKR